MAKKKKKVTKKASARNKTPARPKRSPVVASDAAPQEVTQEEDAATSGPKKKKKKPKPKRRAVTAEDVAGKEPKTPEEPALEPEEEVITAVEVELRETVYDLLARESQRRKMQPGECAAMLVELSLTSIASPASTRAAGNLVDDEEPDDDNDAVLEDPEFQDSFEQLVQGGA